jgi:hypothetical protein
VNALVFVQIPAHFREMLRVAEMLRDSGRYRPIVLFPAAYAGHEDDVRRCAEAGIEAMRPHEFWTALSPATAYKHAPAAVAPHVVKAWEVDTVKIPARFTPMWAYMVAYDLSLRAWRLVRGILWRAMRLCARAASALFYLARDIVWAAGRAMRRIPLRGPMAFAARVLDVVTIPLRPLLRWSLVTAFGAIYRRAPSMLPPDIVRQAEVVRGIDRFLEQHALRLMVLPEDNFYYYTNYWIRRLHAHHGGAVVVPFTIANVLEWSESFYNAPTHDADNAVNGLVAHAFPRWVHNYKGKRLVMPPEFVLSNEYLGVTPPLPWLINSGEADAIAVENEFTARYYRRAGLPEEQIRVTGALADDVAFRLRVEAGARREALYAELGLPPGRPLIVCALPPNQLGGYGRPGCEFDDYAELLRFFVRGLAPLADEYNVVVNLHPRITPQQAAAVDESRVRISRRNIAELIPLAAIFVACCSATIRLAAACGVPVVNYDAYCYDYEDFKTIPGVIEIRKREQYVATLERIARDKAEHERLRALQADFAAREMRIDGKAGERLLALCDEIVRRRAAPAAA